MKYKLYTKFLGLVLGLSLTGGAAAVWAQTNTSAGQTKRSEQQQTMKQNKDTPDKSDSQDDMKMQEMMKNCMKMMKMMDKMDKMDMKDGSMMKMDGNTDKQMNTVQKPNKMQ